MMQTGCHWGNTKLERGLILAPMAGVTDFTFRHLCRVHGAEYVVTEMISAKALHYRDKKTAVLAEIREEESPAAIQIFGCEPEIMAEAAAMLASGDYPGCTSSVRPAAIDINMGCPARKIVANGEGCALMRSPDLIYRIVSACTAATSPYHIPITVKIRSGWDEHAINAVPAAQAAEAGGAAAIAVHGRTRAQMYAPPVDRASIRAVKAAVSIPVIANGDIASGEDARIMLAETGCDGLMIGRGAMGNPWLFAEIRAALDDLPYTPPTTAERIETALLHLEGLVARKGMYTGVHEARKHMAWYIRGLRGVGAARERINHAQTPEEIVAALAVLKAEND